MTQNDLGPLKYARPPDKSLDASGESAFLNLPGAEKLNVVAAPVQLRGSC